MHVPTVQKDQKDNNVVIKPRLFLANNVTNNFYESDYLAYSVVSGLYFKRKTVCFALINGVFPFIIPGDRNSQLN